MQISSRFTLAIHIFACIDTFQHAYKVTSDFLAGSTNVNPVIIRKILGQLKAAGLLLQFSCLHSRKLQNQLLFLLMHLQIPGEVFLDSCPSIIIRHTLLFP